MSDEGALSRGPRISVPDTQVIKVCLGGPVAPPALVPDVIRVKHGHSSETEEY